MRRRWREFTTQHPLRGAIARDADATVPMAIGDCPHHWSTTGPPVNHRALWLFWNGCASVRFTTFAPLRGSLRSVEFWGITYDPPTSIRGQVSNSDLNRHARAYNSCRIDERTGQASEFDVVCPNQSSSFFFLAPPSRGSPAMARLSSARVSDEVARLRGVVRTPSIPPLG